MPSKFLKNATVYGVFVMAIKKLEISILMEQRKEKKNLETKEGNEHRQNSDKKIGEIWHILTKICKVEWKTHYE